MQTTLIVSTTLPPFRRTNGKVEVLVVHPTTNVAKLRGRSFQNVLYDDTMFEEDLPSALREVIRLGKITSGVF